VAQFFLTHSAYGHTFKFGGTELASSYSREETAIFTRVIRFVSSVTTESQANTINTFICVRSFSWIYFQCFTQNARISQSEYE